jgi:hypothetical protein
MSGSIDDIDQKNFSKEFYMKALFVTATALLISTFASARPVNITKLNCSGMGMAGGYTTVKLNSPNTVAISMVKYGQVFTDNNVRIVSVQFSPIGQLKVNLQGGVIDSALSLILSPTTVGPAYFVTPAGTDLLTCESHTDINVR